MKKISILIVILIITSCYKQNSLEGIYSATKGEKVTIEHIDTDRYRIYSNRGWSEVATLSQQILSGRWHYTKDHKKADLKGEHIATYSDRFDSFDVKVRSSTGKLIKKTRWKKIKDKRAKKIIYLTFDDGPLGGSRNVMSVLEELDIPATLFIVGTHAKEHGAKDTETLKLLKKSNNVVLANHTYSHADNRYTEFYSNPSRVVEDIEKNRREVLSYISPWDRVFKANIAANIVRLPGRNAWSIDNYTFLDNKDVKSSLKKLNSEGFDVIGWDIEWHMARGKPVESIDQILDRVDLYFSTNRNKIPGHSIILMHDVMFYHKEDRIKLRSLLIKLKDRGYHFKTLKDI